jgi:cytochrome c-type biogenesis protein CcmH
VTTFVLIAGLLAALAVAFAVWSLWRVPANQARADRRVVNVALYRQRKAEIERDAANGDIDQVTRETMLAELGASLLDESSDDASGAAPVVEVPRDRRVVVVVCALMIPLAATAMYRQLGAREDWALADALTVLRNAPEANNLEALDRLTVMLDERLVKKPGDGETLFLLGHARMRQGEYAGAVEAFAALRPLETGDLTVLVSLAQARYLADEGRVTPETKALMDRALAANPHEALVLEMLALDAIRSANYAAAVGYLERALAGGVEGERAASLEAGLARARAALAAAGGAPTGTPAITTASPTEGSDAPAATSEGSATAASRSARVQVSVAIAPSAQVGPSARVFVIARQIGGPPMPIAVRALSVAELPTVIELSDADAMQPSRLLSQFDQVEVLARLSQSGTPTRQAGDLEAAASPVKPSEQPRLSLTLGG